MPVIVTSMEITDFSHQVTVVTETLEPLFPAHRHRGSGGLARGYCYLVPLYQRGHLLLQHTFGFFSKYFEDCLPVEWISFVVLYYLS